MPGILADTFAAAGADLSDHVQLRPVDRCTERASRTAASSAPSRCDAMADEIHRVCGAREAAAFTEFCAWLVGCTRRAPSFIDRNYDSVLDLARDGRALWQLIRSVRCDVSHPRSRRTSTIPTPAGLLLPVAVAGLSPFQALAVYCVITYMDTVGRRLLPREASTRSRAGSRTQRARQGCRSRTGRSHADPPTVGRSRRRRVQVGGGDASLPTPWSARRPRGRVSHAAGPRARAWRGEVSTRRRASSGSPVFGWRAE